MALKADLLYPDCLKCGAAGAVAVDRATRQPTKCEFWCNRCGRGFDPQLKSDWFGVFELENRLRVAWVNCEIRDMTCKQAAWGQSIGEEGMKQRYQDARAALDEIRRDQRAVESSGSIASGDD